MNGGLAHSAAALDLAIKFQDTRAQNIANANTVGYRKRVASAEAFSASLRAAVSLTLPDFREAIDFTPGDLRQTGGALDLAIEGEGWFVLDTERGPRFTRNGEFQLDAQGQLVAFDGSPVQGEAGPIQADPARGPLAIDASGQVTQDGEAIGRIRLVTFDDERRLTADADGRFRAGSFDEPREAPDARVRQGSLEHSNVNVIDELVQMIAGFRAFEAAQRAMVTVDRVHGQYIGART